MKGLGLWEFLVKNGFGRRCRYYSFVGAAKLSVLERIKNGLIAGGVSVTDVDTHHYKGLYFEMNGTGQLGLIISSKTGSFFPCLSTALGEKQLLFELRSFGRDKEISNLIHVDLSIIKRIMKSMNTPEHILRLSLKS
jgi:hypothetical protein